MEHVRIFQAVWISPTSTLGHIVKITDNRNLKTVTVSVGMSEHEDAKDFAIEFLKSKGIEVKAYGNALLGYFLMTDNFENQIK